MLTTAVSNDRGPGPRAETNPGPMLRLLLRRRGLILVAAWVLMVLAGVAGSDAGDKAHLRYTLARRG